MVECFDDILIKSVSLDRYGVIARGIKFSGPDMHGSYWKILGRKLRWRRQIQSIFTARLLKSDWLGGFKS